MYKVRFTNYFCRRNKVSTSTILSRHCLQEIRQEKNSTFNTAHFACLLATTYHTLEMRALNISQRILNV